MNRTKRFHAALLLALCLGALSWARGIMATTPLNGEEGDFAELAVNRPAGPLYLLMARLDGENLYFTAKHPALLYQAVRGAGWLARPWLINGEMNAAAITPRLRWLFGMPSLVAWWLLCLGALFVVDNRWYGKAGGLVIAAGICPLAVLSATQLQIDGSVGIALVGPFVMGLVICTRWRVAGVWRVAILFTGAFMVGLGKQEWSFALAAAVVAWVAVRLVGRLRGGARKPWGSLECAAILIGVAVGNLLSFSFDPLNYIEGLHILLRFGKAANIVTGSGPIHWLQNSVHRLPWMVTPLLLAGLIPVIGALRRAASPQAPPLSPCAMILAFFAEMLFAGFFISSWNAEPRYFSPALLALAACIVAMLPLTFDRRISRILLAITLVIGVHSLGFLAWRTVQPPRSKWVEIPATARGNAQVLILSTGQAWNQRDVDFVGSSLDPEFARQLVAAHGKRLQN